MRLGLALLPLLLTSCAIVRESYPSRTATEELLISEAADEAAANLKIIIPADRLCFLDSSNFEGTDAHYVISAIRESLLQQGIALMETRDKADTIIEIRAGAISIDSKGRAVIIPGLSPDKLLGLPQSVSGVGTYSQWTRKTDTGVVKIRAFAYDRASGKLISTSEVAVGISHRRRVAGQQSIIPRKAD